MISRNLRVNGRRTSLRLEADLWAAVDDVARRRCLTVTDLVAEIDRQRGDDSLTGALRVTVLCYYRNMVEQLDRYGLTRAAMTRPLTHAGVEHRVHGSLQ